MDSGASWNTLKEYQLQTDKNAQASSVFVTDLGKIYVIGSAIDSSDLPHWIIMNSLDGGSTWNIIGDFLLASGAIGGGIDIWANDVGKIVATGVSGTRISNDGGQTWTLTDTIQVGYGIAVNSLGDIFIVGHHYFSDSLTTGSTGYHGVTRKSSDGGQTWVYSDYYYAHSRTEFNSITLLNDNTIYVGADQKDGSPWDYHYKVRKSADGGATWNYIDDYQSVVDVSSRVKSIFSASDGYTYSTGNTCGSVLASSQSNCSLIVRKVSHATNISSNVYNFQENGVQYSTGVAISNSLSNVMYAVGTGKSVNYQNDWVTKKSTDGGETWSLSDSFVCGDFGCEAKEIVTNSNGNIFAVGTNQGSTTNQFYSMVRRSLDNGLTWTQSDLFQLSSGNPSYGVSIVSLSDNTLFYAASGFDATFKVRWLIKKSTNNGASWVTIDNYDLGTSGAQPLKMKIDSNDHIYVLGIASGHRVIRKSTDKGASWVNIFDSTVSGFHPRDLAVKSNGYFYLAATEANKWVVKKSTDGGLTWVTLDNFMIDASSTLGFPASININNLNEIVVGGYIKDIKNNPHWVLRRSTDDGLTWTTVDLYSLPDGSETGALNSVTFCGNNQICSIGYIMDKNNISHWIFRKLSPVP